MAPISLKKGKIDQLADDLVQATTNLEKGADNFNIALEFAVSNFRFHRFLDVNSFDVTRKLDGLRDKFSIHCQNFKADRLKSLKEDYLGKPFSSSLYEVNTEAHFGILSLLLNLSKSPVNCGEPLESSKLSPDFEEGINWKEYLLDGEDQLQLGINISDEQRRALEETDEDDFFGFADDERKLEVVNEQKSPSSLAKDSDDTYLEYDVEEKDLQWLQRNVIPQYWKGENVHLPIARDSGDSNSQAAKVLQIAPKSTQLVHDLTENVVVRETLWMLQGIATAFVYRYVDDKFIVRDDVALRHMSQETLQSILLSFSSTGNKIQELKKFVTDASDIGKKELKIIRAFSYSINCFMNRVRREIGDIEHQIVAKNELYTILTLEQKITNLLSDVDLVFEVYVACVKVMQRSRIPPNERLLHIVDTLFKTVCNLDAFGIAGSLQVCVVIPIFLETIRPFFNDLGLWVSSGKLPFVCEEEFFIYEDKNTTKDDSEAWKNHFRIRLNEDDDTKLAVPSFLSDVAEKILLTGKSCDILEQAGDNITEQETSSFEVEFLEQLFKGLDISWKNEQKEEEMKYSDLMVVGNEAVIRKNGFSQLLQENFIVVFQRNYERFSNIRNSKKESNCIQSTIEKSKSVLAEKGPCRPPFKKIFMSSLNALIDERYTQTSNALLTLLKDRFRFKEHFGTMKKFFLMEAGDVMSAFYSEIFAKIRGREFWQSTSYLTNLLHESLQLRFPHLVNKLTAGVKAESRAVSRNVANVQSADGIYLHYEMDWPLTIIFDRKAEEKYNAIFSFLLQVKRALWSLEQLRIADLQLESPRRGSVPEDPNLMICKSTSNQTPGNLRQKMFVLRVKLLHFVQSFHAYLMTRILHSSGLEFKAQIADAKDFEEIVMLHLSFLEKVYDRCLLSPKVGFAKEAITRILNISLNFQRHWDLGLAKVREEDIQAIENEFKKCNHFIQSFLNNLIKRGSFPHLELLSLSLWT